MAFPVQFLAGTSQQYKAISPDNYTFYYTTDDSSVYLGSTKLSNVFSKTTSEWGLDRTFVGQVGTFYIYTDYIREDQYDQHGDLVNTTYKPGIKLGDGVTYLIDAPFLNDKDDINVSKYEKADWNNKISFGRRINDTIQPTNSKTYTIDQQEEQLIFATTL